MSYSGDPVQIAQEALIRGTERLFDILPRAVKLIIRDELWKVRNDRQGKPFKSFEGFVLHSLPEGLEIPSMARLEDFVKDDPEVVKMVENEVGALNEKAGNPTGNNQHHRNGSNTTIPKKQDRGKSYLLKRLKRDNPEIAEDYIQGNYPSVRQAAIAAGIVKVKTPLEIAMAAFKKLTDDEKEVFKNEIL